MKEKFYKYIETQRVKSEELKMKTYEVTITRTGTIIVEAENEQEALDKVLSMSSEKIDETGNITGWQPSDAEEVE